MKNFEHFPTYNLPNTQGQILDRDQKRVIYYNVWILKAPQIFLNSGGKRSPSPSKFFDTFSYSAANDNIKYHFSTLDWIAKSLLVHFICRGSPYGVHFIRRDSPYGVHFIRRDCSYGVHFNSNSKVHALSGLYPSSFFFSILPTNYTGEQNKKKKRCPEYFTWFRSIRDHRCLNEKPFFPNRVKFSRNFWFLRQFLRLVGNFFGVLKTLFGPFIVLKTNVSMPWFQCKIGFKNGPPRAAIFEKNKMGLRFGFGCHV